MDNISLLPASHHLDREVHRHLPPHEGAGITVVILYSAFAALLTFKIIHHCTVKKEMRCSEDSEILHEVARHTARKSEKHELFRVVSRNPRNTSFTF